MFAADNETEAKKMKRKIILGIVGSTLLLVQPAAAQRAVIDTVRLNLHIDSIGLEEDNVYLNATFKKRTSEEWNWFAGAAYAYCSRRIGGAAVAGDCWQERGVCRTDNTSICHSS